MKGYIIPEMEIHRFDSDEILTGSANVVDNYYSSTPNTKKAVISWDDDLLSVPANMDA